MSDAALVTLLLSLDQHEPRQLSELLAALQYPGNEKLQQFWAAQFLLGRDAHRAEHRRRTARTVVVAVVAGVAHAQM